ncbi:galactose/glucose ABC transporter substrate-binding protein MglB [Clostridium estertheticum]|uniref:galactose ABC transporter substrate-binding protein n=1 Tax=Clostridium estertheticum TaxID=238834 RepID=UPI001C6E0544|nr:galactose ABC transporter substrate-binding protein [Clostridium estertheticum]MBW9173745.1 galactose/glucose ABC transporter substrate-binding protein MglB [Clostridium estertheticum]WLC74926.1 galactose/glucose ABC transporter substrate-binding protein MglB [Clostridium estertheticum]
MKNIKKNIIVFIIISVVFIFIWYIYNNASSKVGYKTGLPKVGAVIYKYDDEFMSYILNSMEDESYGKVALNVNDSQNDQNIQLRQVDEMISNGVRAIAINLVDPKAAQIVIDKAKAYDLPVIFFNKEPETSVLNSYNKAWFVGTDSKEAGILQGKMIVDLWNQNKSKWDKNHDGKLSYVLLKGEPGHPDAEARSKYALDEIKKAGIPVEKLDEAIAMWDEAKAKDKMDAWISKFNNKIEFVISNNDVMALGAIDSLEKAGYLSGNKLIPVVGIDAIPAAIKKIKEGKMVGTVLNDANSQGKAIIDLVTNVAKGKNIFSGTSWRGNSDKSVRIHYVIIIKDNVDEAEQAYK